MAACADGCLGANLQGKVTSDDAEDRDESPGRSHRPVVTRRITLAIVCKGRYSRFQSVNSTVTKRRTLWPGATRGHTSTPPKGVRIRATKMRLRGLNPSIAKALASAAAALFLAASGFAQIDTGSIVGTVRDSSGAIVAKATVTATNKATNVTLTTTSNGSGEYQFSAVQPGTYAVKASAAGFGTQEVPDVEINVQT